MRPKRPRRLIQALTGAACAHLLAFLALGWRVPKAPPLPQDALPPVELQLFRRAPTTTAAGAQPPVASHVRSVPVRSNPAEASPPPAPGAAPSPSASQVAEGPPDCAPEDLPLLTDAEKTRCRNAVDADRERRLARGADARAARQVARANAAPAIDAIPAEKRAYYDAVAAAYQGPGRLPGIKCGGVSFPLLSGVETNKNIFEKKKKRACHVVPPQGVLTEELGLDPP